jgi:hypothetical protein
MKLTTKQYGIHFLKENFDHMKFLVYYTYHQTLKNKIYNFSYIIPLLLSFKNILYFSIWRIQ